ncbi:MAG: hypothetical protein M3R70_08455 [Actinomycetota bacterium]|nr:hypothetical protein [Actinomycetota bacterium]
MFRKFLERLRGSSRSPDDLAVGTKRPGDFVEETAVAHGEAPVPPREGKPVEENSR